MRQLKITKSIFMLLLPLLAFAFCGCEEEADLRFSKESVSDPANVKIEYYSPDPMHCPKAYCITANSCASELTIKCTNAQSISLTHGTGGRFYCEAGHWTATLVDSKTIKIVFDAIDEDAELDPDGSADYLVVQSSTRKELLKEYISVDRLLRYWAPIAY